MHDFFYDGDEPSLWMLENFPSQASYEAWLEDNSGNTSDDDE